MLENHEQKDLEEQTENTDSKKEQKLSKQEVKDGWAYLIKQGKVFKLFLLMVGYFLLLDILSMFGVIRGIWVLVFTVPIIFIILAAYLVYINKNGNDEMK